MATADIDVGFAATAMLTKALKEKKQSQLKSYEFKKECCAMLATIVTKIQERSPLKYNFVRKLAHLDPRLIVIEPDKLLRCLNRFLQSLLTQNGEQMNRLMVY